MPTERFRKTIEDSTGMTFEQVQATPLAVTWEKFFGAEDRRRQRERDEKILVMFKRAESKSEEALK